MSIAGLFGMWQILMFSSTNAAISSGTSLYLWVACGAIVIFFLNRWSAFFELKSSAVQTADGLQNVTSDADKQRQEAFNALLLENIADLKSQVQQIQDRTQREIDEKDAKIAALENEVLQLKSEKEAQEPSTAPSEGESVPVGMPEETANPPTHDEVPSCMEE
jgi:hypothetical protein